MTRREKRYWAALPRSERTELLRFYRALLARTGASPSDLLVCEWARLTAEAWWTAREASGAAVREGVKRWRGTGRRPTSQAVDRRLKRAGLGVSTLDAMLRRLEALAGKNGHAPGDDLADRLLRLPVLSPGAEEAHR